MKKKDRISTQASEASLGNNLFDSVDLAEIQLTPGGSEPKSLPLVPVTERKKGRIELRREKSGRGGKTVTVLGGIGKVEDRKDLLKALQKQCACGGTIREDSIEIQGDKRSEVEKFLKDQGYRVVLSGG